MVRDTVLEGVQVKGHVFVLQQTHLSSYATPSMGGRISAWEQPRMRRDAGKIFDTIVEHRVLVYRKPGTRLAPRVLLERDPAKTRVVDLIEREHLEAVR